MEDVMKGLLVVIATALLSACATTGLPEATRLALVEAHAGEPVKQIRYTAPMGWSRVDAQHVLLDMRPRETWLLTLTGQCLDWGSGAPGLIVKSQTGFLLGKFDSVQTVGSNVTCRIDEIRPVDMKAVRAAEKQLRDQPPSGT